MSKTKAELETLVASLKKQVKDLRDEATGWHEEAETLRRELNARVDRMGENKPWKLFTGGALFGAVFVSVLWAVV